MSDTQLKTLEDGGEEKEFCVVSVESSQQSSVISTFPDGTADKATDGDISTMSETAFEPAPWYSAELGGRFTAIRLNITQFSMGNTHHLTIYTLENGVETECARHNEDELWRDRPWSAMCQNAGTGFKISAVPKPYRTTTNMILQEITVEVQLSSI